MDIRVKFHRAVLKAHFYSWLKKSTTKSCLYQNKFTSHTTMTRMYNLRLASCSFLLSRQLLKQHFLLKHEIRPRTQIRYLSQFWWLQLDLSHTCIALRPHRQMTQICHTQYTRKCCHASIKKIISQLELDVNGLIQNWPKRMVLGL